MSDSSSCQFEVPLEEGGQKAFDQSSKGTSKEKSPSILIVDPISIIFSESGALN